MEEGSKNSIAYVVKVAGKNMQPDFEPVIERKFHNYINCIEGVYHTGQRDMQRTVSATTLTTQVSASSTSAKFFTAR